MKKGIDFVGVGSVAICHDGNGKYLLGLRSDKCRDEHFKWDPLGSGGVKHGEKIHDAVLREVKEETGADGSGENQMGKLWMKLREEL